MNRRYSCIPENIHYSSLSQIDTSNVKSLQAWIYHTAMLMIYKAERTIMKQRTKTVIIILCCGVVPGRKMKQAQRIIYCLRHCVGHMPNKTEVDVPLTYADYYFVEAMKRYKALN